MWPTQRIGGAGEGWAILEERVQNKNEDEITDVHAGSAGAKAEWSSLAVRGGILKRGTAATPARSITP